MVIGRDMLFLSGPKMRWGSKMTDLQRTYRASGQTCVEVGVTLVETCSGNELTANDLVPVSKSISGSHARRIKRSQHRYAPIQSKMRNTIQMTMQTADHLNIATHKRILQRTRPISMPRLKVRLRCLLWEHKQRRRSTRPKVKRLTAEPGGAW